MQKFFFTDLPTFFPHRYRKQTISFLGLIHVLLTVKCDWPILVVIFFIKAYFGIKFGGNVNKNETNNFASNIYAFYFYS